MMNGDDWDQITVFTDVWTKYNFPQLPAQKFEQISEITHGIHALRKGIQCASYHNKKEVELNENIKDYEEYKYLISQPVQTLQIYVKRQSRKPRGYTRLEAMNVLPKWPGKVKYKVIKIQCFLNNKKTQVIQILNDTNDQFYTALVVDLLIA